MRRSKRKVKRERQHAEAHRLRQERTELGISHAELLRRSKEQEEQK